MSIGENIVRTLRLAVPVYLASLVLALVPGLVGMAGVVAVAGDRPWRTDLLGPNWINLLLEVLGAAVYHGGSAGLSLMLLAGLLLVPLALVAQIVAYSFLAGGILERLTHRAPSERPFLAHCRRWFWPSLRLSLFGGAVVASVGFALSTGLVLLGRWVSADVAAVLQVVVQAVIVGWVELARALMVRNVDATGGRALLLATRGMLRPWFLLLWLLLALPPLGLLVAAANPPSVGDAFSTGQLLLALGYGQLVAFAMAWTKVVRLAVAAVLSARLAPERRDRSAYAVSRT